MAGSEVVVIPVAAAGKPERRVSAYYTDDGAFRFHGCIIAGHAPTYREWKRSYTVTAGLVDADLDSLPHTAAEWKLGEPYSYLIDVCPMAHSRAGLLNLFSGITPSEPPLGFPPSDDVLAERAD